MSVFAFFFRGVRGHRIFSTIGFAFSRISTTTLTLVFNLTLMRIVGCGGTRGVDVVSRVTGVLSEMNTMTCVPVSTMVNVLNTFISNSTAMSVGLFSGLRCNATRVLGLPGRVMLNVRYMNTTVNGVVYIGGVITTSTAVNVDNERKQLVGLGVVPLLFCALLAILTSCLFLLVF